MIIRILLAFFLFASPCLAGSLQQAHKAVIAALSEPSTPPTYLVEEYFNGSDTLPSGWTVVNGSGFIYNYATSPAPLEGAGSLYLPGSYSRIASYQFSAASTIYTHVLFQKATYPGDDSIFRLRDGSGNMIISVDIHDGADLRLIDSTYSQRATTYGSDPLSGGGAFHIWLDAIVSGSDTVFNMYLSASGTKPGSTTLSWTATGTTYTFRDIFLHAEAISTIFDSILVSTTEF